MDTERPMIVAHDITELPAARDELRLYLEKRRLPADVTYDLLTCVQEACKNALRFADSPRGVHTRVVVGSDEIVAIVRDFGAGLARGRSGDDRHAHADAHDRHAGDRSLPDDRQRRPDR